MTTHEQFMQRALDLAYRGFPAVAPNPVVGCVIVHDGRVVAEGWHQQFGGPHAEVNAVNQLPENIPVAECTVYVTLEPCAHEGKTPPCADMLVAKGFKHVVVAAGDPNPLVSGMGLERLRAAGVTVETGIQEKAARHQNRRFFTYFEKRRPYIVLKWAQTADGFISRFPVPPNRQDNIITRNEALSMAHRLRAESMAVMVGKKTVESDNPFLTTRLVKGNNPLRVFIDRDLSIPRKFNIYNNEAPTVVFNAVKDFEEGHIRFIKADFDRFLLQQICDKLYHMNVQSLLVEGGAKLLKGFVDADLWDEAMVFVNPELFFGSGVKGPEFALKNTYELVGEDKLFHQFRNETITTGTALEV